VIVSSSADSRPEACFALISLKISKFVSEILTFSARLQDGAVVKSACNEGVDELSSH